MGSTCLEARDIKVIVYDARGTSLHVWNRGPGKRPQLLMYGNLPPELLVYGDAWLLGPSGTLDCPVCLSLGLLILDGFTSMGPEKPTQPRTLTLSLIATLKSFAAVALEGVT